MTHSHIISPFLNFVFYIFFCFDFFKKKNALLLLLLLAFALPCLAKLNIPSHIGSDRHHGSNHYDNETALQCVPCFVGCRIGLLVQSESCAKSSTSSRIRWRDVTNRITEWSRRRQHTASCHQHQGGDRENPGQGVSIWS